MYNMLYNMYTYKVARAGGVMGVVRFPAVSLLQELRD